MTPGPEYVQVELPLIRQLEGLGWTHLEGAPPGSVQPTDPAKSGRVSFSEVFLNERLRSFLGAHNRGPDGSHWLTGRRLSQVVNALSRIAVPSLIDANQRATSCF